MREVREEVDGATGVDLVTYGVFDEDDLLVQGVVVSHGEIENIVGNLTLPL